jgi:hypothetical protein
MSTTGAASTMSATGVATKRKPAKPGATSRNDSYRTQEREIAAGAKKDYVTLAKIFLHEQGGCSWEDLGANTKAEIETMARDICERNGLGGCKKKRAPWGRR